MIKLELDLKNIKLSKKEENTLWFCIADLKTHNLSEDFYYEIYRKLRLELGIDSIAVLDMGCYEICDSNCYFDNFESIFYKSSVKDKLNFIEIFFNELFVGLYLSVMGKIKGIYGDTNIPNDLTFEYLKGYDACNYYNRYSFSFDDLEELIEKACENINRVNKILEESKIEYAFINKTEITNLSQKVSDFINICNNMGDEVIVLVRKTEQFVFSNLVEPVINLTNNLKYKSANKEFLRALDSFKIGNYIDCVNGVASSLESTIKIICDYKTYKLKGNEPLSDLVDILFKNGFFDFYTEKQKEDMKTNFKKNIGFLRNTVTAHGNGTIDKDIPEHTAKYVINMGASLILYLIDIYEDTK